MLKGKTDLGPIYRVRSSVVTPVLSLIGGSFVRFVGGGPPDALSSALERVTMDDVPATATIGFIDADRYQARHDKLTSPPEKPRRFTRADLLAHFSWSPAQFALAESVGFPRPSSTRLIGTRGAEPLWVVSEVEAWIGNVRALKL